MEEQKGSNVLGWIALVVSILAFGAAVTMLFFDMRAEPTKTDTSSTQGTSQTQPKKTVTDVDLGLMMDYPATWTIQNEPSINPELISHSGFTVTGSEGSITVLNTTGLGGGPCSASGQENITISTAAGDVSVCHAVNSGGSETWSTANEGPKNIDNDLKLGGADMSIVISAKANSANDAALILASLKTINIFVPKTAADVSGGTRLTTTEWEKFTHESGKYSLLLPPGTSAVYQDAGTTTIAAPVDENGTQWPSIAVSHVDSDFFHPTAGADVVTWINEHETTSEALRVEKSEILIDGHPTAYNFYPASLQAYSSDTYYAIDGTQLYEIQFINAGGKRDEELYKQFVAGFKFI